LVDENLLPKRGNNDEIIIRPGDKFLFTDSDERTRRILAVALFQKAAEQDYELDICRHRVRQFQVGMNDILFNKQCLSTFFSVNPNPGNFAAGSYFSSESFEYGNDTFERGAVCWCNTEKE
jgi:hypothetical protein